MPPTTSQSLNLLALINPGRTSRHYMEGLVQSALAAGCRCETVNLGEVWGAQRDGPKAYHNCLTQLAARIAAAKCTHCIGYAHNATSLVAKAPGGDPMPLPTLLGLTSIMIWTDHPEWCVNGTVMDLPIRGVLSHPLHTHILKSRSAASECSSILGWPNVRSFAMAECRDWIDTRPATEPTYDVSMVVSDAAAPSAISAAFLDDDDPDVQAIDLKHAEVAANAARMHLSPQVPDAIGPERIDALLSEWISRKISRPNDSFWSLSRSLLHQHRACLDWFSAEPRRWYSTIACLRGVVNWRRNFWPAWLARRCNLGVFGCDASCWGVSQSPEQKGWIGYRALSDAYRSGACALSINAGHDEEGVTHKPFQIASSGTAMVHHATQELADLFTPGREILTFTRGPELIKHIEACRNRDYRINLGLAAQERCRRDHDWSCRLDALLKARPES